MTKTKIDLENELTKIEEKINSLIRDFIGIKKSMKTVQKQIHTKRDNKKIIDLKSKITSL